LVGTIMCNHGVRAGGDLKSGHFLFFPIVYRFGAIETRRVE
jgi:hypothetical protein